MTAIGKPRLSVAIDADLQKAAVVVRCNVQFTDFEVHAMNQLGLGYTLRCRIVSKDLWYETTSLTLENVELPQVPGMATLLEEVVFEAVAPLDALREHMFTRDELLAELTLLNDQTGAEQVARSETQTVDLAA